MRKLGAVNAGTHLRAVTAQTVMALFLLALMETSKAMTYEPIVSLPASGPVWSLPTAAAAVSFSGLMFAWQVLGEAETTGKDWANLGVIGVMTMLLAYIITKRDPYSQEKNNQLINNITDQFTKTAAKITEENSITLKSIVMDHKEILKDTVEKLVGEKRSQREDQHAHAEKQLERVIHYYDLQVTRFIDVLREGDNVKSVVAGNSKSKGSGT